MDSAPTALHDAVLSCDLAKVEDLLRAKVSPVSVDQNRTTALMASSVTNQIEILSVLLSASSDDGFDAVNAVNATGRTALMAAVGRGSPEAVELLMAHGASTKAQDDAGKSVEDYCDDIVDPTVQEEVLALLLEVPGAAQVVAKRRDKNMKAAQNLRRRCQRRPETCKDKGKAACCQYTQSSSSTAPSPADIMATYESLSTTHARQL